MRLELINASVVVLAERHNPTILHPSFLQAQKVVPPDWELAEDPISTPVVAIVKYRNGITFNVDESKFQVIDHAFAGRPDSSPMGRLVQTYTACLPHVAYTAVGINFAALVKCEKPESILKRQFLKRGSANYEEQKPSAFALRLIYELENTRLRIALDTGNAELKGEESSQRGILVDANYHKKLSSEESYKAIEPATKELGKHLQHFRGLAHTILRLESKE